MSAEPSESDGAGQSRIQGLAIVATPIGNAADITLRAIEVLKSADAILCEDTRVSPKLLARHGIRRPLLAYHEHNAERMRPLILERLRRGESLALISDAGQPLISDPGFKLVRAALAEGLPVTALPGPSAALTALVLSGLPTDRFFFDGFLPQKQAGRRARLGEIASVPGTLILFESPRRLADLLADAASVLGDRPAAVAVGQDGVGDLAGVAVGQQQAGAFRGEMAVAPREQGLEHIAEITAARGEQIFVARRALAVAPALQQPRFDQRLQAPGQHVGRDVEALLEFIEAGEALEGIAQDQDAPPFPHTLQAAGDRALQIAEAFMLHRVTSILIS